MNASKAVSVGIYFGIGFAIVNILGNCGGGVPNSGTEKPNPVIPAPLIDYANFAPYRVSRTGIWNNGQWTATVIDAATIDVRWGDSIEEHRIRPLAGESWVMLDAYRDVPTGNRYASIATRAEIDRGDGRGWQALPVAGLESSLYAPAAWDGRAIVIRQWGCIRNDPKYGGSCEKKWFHIHRLELVKQVANSCWLAPDRIRDVIKQSEAWHDSAGGWTRGSGPMGADGTPTGDGVVMNFWQMMARDAGYLWQSSTGDCLVQ